MNWKRLLPSDKKTWIAIVVVVGVLAYNIPKSWQQDRELESDAGEAIGTVVNVYRSGPVSYTHLTLPTSDLV